MYSILEKNGWMNFNNKNNRTELNIILRVKRGNK